MINPMLALIAQNAATQAGVPVPETQGNPIDVVANRTVPAAPVQEEYDPYFGNRRALEARDNAERELSDYRKENPRKGLFGMKGTLRDVLGILGDSFLVQSGNAPLYAPQRMRELQQDQMVGFTNDPMAAAERVGGETGMALMEAEQERRLKQAQAESLGASRQDMSDTRAYNKLKDARMLAQRVLAQSGAFDAEGNLTPGAQSILQTAARNAGVSVEQLVGPDTSPETLRLLGEADMSVNQQRQLPFTERRVATGERNARTAEVRAARPPAPKSVTEATELQRIRTKVNRGEELSPGDAATWRRYTEGSRSSGSVIDRLIQSGQTTPAPSRLRIRPVGQ